MFESESDFLNKLYKYRWGMNKGDASNKETPEFWSELAKNYVNKVHSKEGRAEILTLVNRFSWSKDETVLDLGAGPGSYAIPLASKVKAITSLDPSQIMLDYLNKQALKENVSNIKTIASRWLEAENIEQHDTVLSMNSLGMLAVDDNHDSYLDKAIIKMRNLAKKRIIILIPHADSAADQQMKNAIGLKATSMERKKIAALYYAMVDCGMLPDLNIITRPFRWSFTDLEDATNVLSRKIGLKTDEQKDKLKNHLTTRLKKDGDGFKMSYDCPQALFYWSKAILE